MTSSVTVRRVLPCGLRTPTAVLAVFGLVTLIVLGALVAGGTEAGPADGWVPLAEGGWHQLALVIDFGGEPVGATVLVAALAVAGLATGHRRAAVLAVAGPGAAVATTTLLKPLAGRTIYGPENLSYPSGHTAAATAMAIVLALLLVDRLSMRRGTAMTLLLVLAVVAAAAMAWSQVALGAHYETDTVGGFAAAVAVVPATAWLVDRLAPSQ